MLTSSHHMTRRRFAAASIALASTASRLRASASIDDILRAGIETRGIPAVAAMAATGNKITYEGALGRRDDSGAAVSLDSIFAAASMIKPLTSVAAMQLVERGRLLLDEPAAKHLPELAKLQVIDHFDPQSGKGILRPVRTPVTLRHLLTHTSGFAYDVWSEEMTLYEKHSDKPAPQGDTAPLVPLVAEPGTSWHYGYSADWTGRLVEQASGLNLEEYFQQNICEPLQMHDTSCLVTPEKFDRYVSRYRRQPDGSLQQEPRKLPAAPARFNGGGDIYTTAGDYTRFMQMFLRGGLSPANRTVLSAQSIRMMASNQIGSLNAGKMHSLIPAVSSDVDFQPGATEKFGFGFLINTTAYRGGRSAASLAWAGIGNTFFWIDPKAGRCAILFMQFLPFCDREAMGLLNDYERAVYKAA